MSDIGDRIDQDLKAALKSGETDVLSVLRLVRSALKNKQIELGRELDEPEIIAVLQKESKQRREASAEYLRGNRQELAAKEDQEAEILADYLPAQLSDDELGKVVDDTIAATGADQVSDMGKVIGMVMSKTQGQADGSRVSALVKQRLQKP